MKHPLEIVAVLAVVIAIAALVLRPHPSIPAPVIDKSIASVTYACNGGSSIAAAYYQGTARDTPAPGQPPHPTGSVTLNFSDGRVMTLAQTISADGVRYANFDDSFVFWSKGEGALVLEGGVQKTYTGCSANISAGEATLRTYTNDEMGFSLRFPEDYTTSVIDTGGDPALYSGKVRFIIPTAMAEGTNLGSDTYISVEEIPGLQTCEASTFFFDPLSAHQATDAGVTYSVASSSDAGAGNRYDETVYALTGTNPCIAVRYYIHYMAFENFPEGTVKKFDEKALLAEFDSIRRTLVVTKK